MTSLKVLNKDFKLRKIYDSNGKDTGKFDRANEGGDWVRVEGIDSYHIGIIISIMTIHGELKDNPLYGPEFGNKSWYLLKELNNEMTHLRKEEYTKETLSKMFRTQNIDQIIVTGDPLGLDPNLMKTTFLVTAITDDTIPVVISEEGGVEI